MSSVIATAFMVYMVYCFLRGYNNPQEHAFKKDPDFFELGYIEREDPAVVYVEEPKPKKKPKKPKKKKPKVEKPKKHPLFDDCCSALKSLGYKATQAKQVAKQVFDGNDITSIEQFIRIAAKA